MSMTLIAHTEVGSGGAANIEFTSIPATFTDLVVKLSLRSTRTGFPSATYLNFNSSGFNASGRILYGGGSGSGQSYGYSDGSLAAVSSAASTANTFSSIEIYIPNYRSSAHKSYSIDYVFENNDTPAEQGLNAGLWANTAAITSILIDDFSTNLFVQHSSASLYGITAGSDGTTVVS
jgi:hypothetical protein